MQKRSALAALGAGLVGLAVAGRRIDDFDVPWNLATGREILTHWALPRVDSLAYTERPVEYVPVLADTLLYGVHQLTGPLGLQLLFGVIVALTFWLVWRRAGGTAAAFLFTGLAVYAAEPFLRVRPVTLSLLLLATLLWALDRHRADPARHTRAALILAAPFMCVWANVHGFSVVGLAIVLAYAGYRVFARLVDGRLGGFVPREDGAAWAPTLATAGLGAAGALCNMGGLQLLTGPLRATRDFGAVTEWASTDLTFIFITEPGAGIMLSVAVLALLVGRPGRVPDLWTLGLAGLAFAMAASAVRMMAPAGVMLMPIAARRLGHLLPQTRASTLLAWALFAAAAPYAAWQSRNILGVGYAPQNLPVDAVAWIKRIQPQGRMWNFSPYGGFLAWQLNPDYQPFIDGRTGWVHDPADVKLAHDSNWDPAAFRTLVDRWNMQWAICRALPGETFCVPPAQSPNWQMAYWDGVSAIYLREGANTALPRYQIFDHLTPLGALVQVAHTQPQAAPLLQADAALALSQAEPHAQSATLAAIAAIATQDRKRFDAALQMLTELAPDHPAIAALQGAWSGR